MSDRLVVIVPGLPQPQGSSRAFVRGGKPVITSDNPRLASWRMDVAHCAQAAMREAHLTAPLVGPVRVAVRFALPKPQRTRRQHPTVRPDVDKLARAVLDALTLASVWVDDAQVVILVAQKAYDPVASTYIEVSGLG